MKRRLPPMQLATLAIGGAVLVASVWLLGFFPLPPVLGPWHSVLRHLWALRLRILLFGLPFGVGGAVALWAQRQLRLGFLGDEWPSADLEPVRRLVESSAWRWISVGAFLVALMILSVRPHHAGSVLLYALLSPAQMARTIQRALFPAKAEPKIRPTFKDLQPIRSEHWGEGRA